MMALFLLLTGTSGFGQDGLKLVLDKEKDRDLNISGSMQFWVRYTSLNPGSKVLNEEVDAVWDLSIRRYRIKFNGKAHEKVRYHVEFGNNNLSYYTENSAPHLLDAFIDYQIHKNFALGIGKHAWSGLARYAAPSSTNALGYDIDFVAAPYVNVYDDILRRMGIYARGNVGRFDLRVVLAKPAFFNGNSTIDENARFADKSPEYQFSSYIKYQFLEKESQQSPFSPGTYLGKKNILNFGVGTMHQPKTSWYLSGQDTMYHNATSFAADFFYEKILRGNKGMTLYITYIHHDIGRNFVRYMGANNPSTSAEPSDFVNGKGNNLPIVGTGSIWYLQVAHIRAADAKNKTQLQPYASLQYSRFNAFNEAAVIYSGGFNYFLNGHKSKITIGYQSRPVFQKKEHLLVEGLRKDMLVMQYQILFGN